jgi:hypothetical protein
MKKMRRSRNRSHMGKNSAGMGSNGITFMKNIEKNIIMSIIIMKFIAFFPISVIILSYLYLPSFL